MCDWCSSDGSWENRTASPLSPLLLSFCKQTTTNRHWLFTVVTMVLISDWFLLLDWALLFVAGCCNFGLWRQCVLQCAGNIVKAALGVFIRETSCCGRSECLLGTHFPNWQLKPLNSLIKAMVWPLCFPSLTLWLMSPGMLFVLSCLHKEESSSAVETLKSANYAGDSLMSGSCAKGGGILTSLWWRLILPVTSEGQVCNRQQAQITEFIQEIVIQPVISMFSILQTHIADCPSSCLQSTHRFSLWYRSLLITNTKYVLIPRGV